MPVEGHEPTSEMLLRIATKVRDEFTDLSPVEVTAQVPTKSPAPSTCGGDVELEIFFEWIVSRGRLDEFSMMVRQI